MPRPRRVTFFHAYPHQVAGAQVVTAHLSSALATAGWEVELVVPDGGPFVEYVRQRDIPVRIVKASRSLLTFGRRRGFGLALRRVAAIVGYWLKLWRVFRSADSVVHVNDHRGVMLAGVPARLAGRPVVWHVHGPLPNRILNRCCAGISTRLVAVSSDTLQALELSRRTTLRKALIIHNCLAGSPAGARAGSYDSRVPASPMIAVGARIHPDKGLDLLLEAMVILLPSHPGLSLVIAGHVQRGYEAYADSLRLQCERLGLSEAVTFLGRVDDAATLFERADVYVQPSRAEPFGLCLLEAMAVGTPVVAFATGGMREVIQHGVNGLLSEAGDSRALAEDLHRLLCDPDLAAACVRGGRACLTAHFSPERFLAQFSALYEGLVSGGPPRVVRVGNAVTLWTIQRNQLVEQRRLGLDLVCLTDTDEWSKRFQMLGFVTVDAPMDRRPGPLGLARWVASVVLVLPSRTRMVLHSHNLAHTLGLRLLALGFRRHLIVETFHNTYELLQPGLARRLVRMALRRTRGRCARALFISDRYEADAARERLVPIGRTEVVGTGIDLVAFRERVEAARPRSDVRADLGIRDDERISIVVARLDPQKGHDLYLTAAALLRRTHPDLHHLLVGHGLDTHRVLDQVVRLGLKDKVQVLGYRDDVPELLSAADVAVLPSRHEGFGRCLVEAMAAGVPTVATDCDGPRMILEDGHDGLLVAMTSEALATGMAAALNDEQLRSDLVERGLLRAAQFDEIAIAHRVGAIYRELDGVR